MISDSLIFQTKQSLMRCVSVSNSTRMGTSDVRFVAWLSSTSGDLA